MNIDEIVDSVRVNCIVLCLLLKGNYMSPSTMEYSLIYSMSVYYTMDGSLNDSVVRVY